jgi:3-hydroxy-5-methyl-1-naphthoate 3-O-methyltransferase
MQEGREGEANSTSSTDTNVIIKATAKNNKRNDKNDISHETIFNMAAGLWVSKTLATALELEVFSKLSGNKSVTLNELQKLLEMESRPAEALATALVSLRLLRLSTSETGERIYSNTRLSETFLDISKLSNYVGDIATIFDKRFYKNWENLIDCLSSNKPVNEFVSIEKKRKRKSSSQSSKKGGGVVGDINPISEFNAKTIEQMKTFAHGMYDINVGPASSLTKLFDFSKYSKLMDIGGFSAGVYALQAVKAYPNLSGEVILTLEPVAELANGYIKQFNLENKVNTKVFDIFEEERFTAREAEEMKGQGIKESNNGYDVAIVSNVLRRNNQEKNKILLKRIYNNLIPDKINKINKNNKKNSNVGTSAIIISEWLLNDQKTGPISSALMNLNMVIESSEGRTYSFAEVSNMLRSVGFVNIQKIETRGHTDFVVGYKKQD